MEQPPPFTAAELTAMQALVRTAEPAFWRDLFASGTCNEDCTGGDVPIEPTELSYKLQQHIAAVLE